MMEILKYDTFWSAVSAIFTVVAAFGVFFAARQFRFDAWVKAQEIFTDEEFVKARERVFPCLENPNSSCTREDALLICRKMDEFAHLAPFLSILSILGRNKAIKFWGNPIAKAWHLLGPFVKQKQDEFGWKTKWAAFQHLGEKAIKGETTLKGKPHAKVS